VPTCYWRVYLVLSGRVTSGIEFHCSLVDLSFFFFFHDFVRDVFLETETVVQCEWDWVCMVCMYDALSILSVGLFHFRTCSG